MSSTPSAALVPKEGAPEDELTPSRRSTRDERIRWLVLAIVAAVAAAMASAQSPPAARETLPARLADGEFWRLATESSEADGYFRSDNLTSNELLYERVIPALTMRVRPGVVYLGVGPEQNFTYMAALRPSM